MNHGFISQIKHGFHQWKCNSVRSLQRTRFAVPVGRSMIVEVSIMKVLCCGFVVTPETPTDSRPNPDFFQGFQGKNWH
jgi:hypothetical protein